MSDFDTNEYIVVAEALLAGQGGPPQAYVRAAVGRTYYSQYGYLRARIEAIRSGTFGGSGWHAQLCEICKKADGKHIRRIGKGLEYMWQLRTGADYEPSTIVIMEDAVNSVAVAKDLREKIRNLSVDELTVIQAELSRWIDHVREKSPMRRWHQ